MNLSSNTGSDTLHGYQWGYDEIEGKVPGKSHEILDQVYQLFVPSVFFLKDTLGALQLDTFQYAFWVQLRKGDCQTRVYYNGPFNMKGSSGSEISNDDVLIGVYPNPGDGEINLKLEGDLYGILEVKLLNAIGQTIQLGQIEKKQVQSQYKFHLANFEDGMYMLQVSGKDKQHYGVKIILKH
jgi:hypothetical protein